MILLARNIKCNANMRGGSIRREASCRILATYTCVQIVLLDRRTQYEND